MSESVVSIVIPAFNAEAYIAEAIKSALGQSFRDLEVVVVDDGSTDKTAHIVKQFYDPRIRLIRQDNLGQSAAINVGAGYSRGTYIKLLDADDWLNPTHIESQLDAVDDSQGVLVSCRWGYFASDFKKPTVQHECTNRSYDDPLEWLVDSLSKDEGMMGGWMWLIPKTVWEKAGGFDPRLNLNNDFHFSIRLLLSSEGVRFAEDAIYSYRKGVNEALSSSWDRKAMESAYLTTRLGTDLLLEQENSPRIRKICADRFQQWLFKFYPEFPDLVSSTESRVMELGGSKLELQGGRLLTLLKPLIGWKNVRNLQCFVYRHGWQRILKMKATDRLKLLD